MAFITVSVRLVTGNRAMSDEGSMIGPRVAV